MSKKVNKNKYLDYCYSATFQKLTTRNHVVTDKEESYAEFESVCKFCKYYECEPQDLVNFKLLYIKDMDGNVVEKNY